MLVPILLALVGCDLGASGKTVLEDSTVSTVDDSADDSPTDDSADDSAEPPDPRDVDDDGDGLSENEGDCDDLDASIHPGATDRCDGVDQDCDGRADEDAVSDDSTEPNDPTPYDLGSLEDNPDHEVVGRLTDDADVDRFSFAVVDSWYDSFTVTISLSNIPSTATYRLTLNRLRSDGDEALGQVDQVFGSGSIELTLEDRSGPEDGGDYEVVVEAIAGADCATAYLLTVGMEG